MTRCPRCYRDHAGPRPIDELRTEGARVLVKALEMDDAKAPEYLRSQWLGAALELAGFCPPCGFNEQTAVVAEKHEAAIRDTEARMQSVSEPQGVLAGVIDLGLVRLQRRT